MEQKITWGIVGLGQVAKRFAKDLIHHTPNGDLLQVASSNPQKAAGFAKEFQCESTDSYLELAQNPKIDAVYISNINSLHFATAKLFLEHNKHVLIEKPAVTKSEEWLELCSISKKNGLIFMEAIKFIHFPAFKKLLKFFLQNPELELTTVKASFGTRQNYNKNENQPIFSSELLGGATYDVGVYPLWLYAFLNYFQNKSGRLWALNTYSPQKSNVDETCDYTMEGEIMGFLEASISKDLDSNAYLKGNNFEVTMHNKWWNPHEISINHNNNNIQIKEEIIGGGFQYEAEHFGKLILTNQKESNLCPHIVSKIVIEWLEQIHS